jgi:hypothetical protein
MPEKKEADSWRKGQNHRISKAFGFFGHGPHLPPLKDFRPSLRLEQLLLSLR